MIHALIPIWIERGHEVTLSPGPPHAKAQADVVIPHVDVSVIDDAYLEAMSRFPVVVNARVRDIRKSAVSASLVTRNDDWNGAVIVKSDLNAGGVPEAMLNDEAQRSGRAPPYPGARALDDYPIFATRQEVPEQVWSTPGLVVEKFRPEQDERGYWTRFWLFFGTRERCRRFCTSAPIVKAGAAILREECEVPDEVRAVRASLGIDYGKIDFVMHQGRAIVLDVNRTPGAAPSRPGDGPSTAQLLAPGLDEFLTAR